MNSISPFLNIMIKASEKASRVAIRDFGEIENLQVAKKGPRDFVTKTDKRVEEILIDELSKAKKNFSFLTEESGKILNNDKDKIWIIDPIDGTTNFLHGIPHFAISVALKIDNERRGFLNGKLDAEGVEVVITDFGPEQRRFIERLVEFTQSE